MQLIFLSLSFNKLTSWRQIAPQEANNVAYYGIVYINDILY